MTKTVKLSPKQLELITALEAQKNEATERFNNLNSKENIVVELVLEQAGITEKPIAAKLDGDSLVFEFKEDNKVKKNNVKPN